MVNFSVECVASPPRRQAFAASDLVMLVRNPERCANKRDDKQRHGSVPTTHAEGFGGPVELWAMPR